MNRAKLAQMACECGLLQKDSEGKSLGISMTSNLREQRLLLIDKLVDYFENTPEGKAAWSQKPRISGEGVKEYETVRAMAAAIVDGWIDEKIAVARSGSYGAEKEYSSKTAWR